MVPLHIEELDHAEQFRKGDFVVLVLVGGVEGMLFASDGDIRFLGVGVVEIAGGEGEGGSKKTAVKPFSPTVGVSSALG